MTTAAMTVANSAELSSPGDFGEEHKRIVRDAFAPTATPAEFDVLWAGARSRHLDPVRKQIHFVKRWDNMRNADVWSSQVSIDGFRAIAEDTGKYDGQDEPEFDCDDEGRVLVARVRVFRKDMSRASVGVAYWEEFVQTKKGGEPLHMWAKMPRHMLAKCAEALALRKAFPEQLAGLYAPEEMGHDLKADAYRRKPLTAAEMVDKARGAVSVEAAEAVLIASPKWPKVRAHAWMRLIELAPDEDAIAAIRARYRADDLAADLLAKLDAAQITVREPAP